MRRTHGVLALAVFLAACGGSGQDPVNPVAPNVPAMAAAARGGHAPAAVTREVTGTLKGRFDFTQMWGTEWWEIYADTTATGTVTHLGLSELRTRHVPDFSTGALTQATFTLLAANGDEITGTYAGTVVIDVEAGDHADGSATFTVTGGTGRFTGATGSFTVTFLEVFDDPSWASAGVTWTIEGTVTY